MPPAYKISPPVLALLMALGGCSSTSSDSPAADGGAGPWDGGDSGLDAPRDVYYEAPTWETSSADSQDGANPDGIPPGWELYSEFSPACKFYVPGEHGQMPDPLQWEPCPVTFPTGAVCQKIKQTWKHTPEDSIADSSFTFFDIDPQSQKPLLAFQRFALWNRQDLSDTIVAEADGPVRFAIMQATQLRAGCDFMLKHANQGKVSVHLYGDDPNKRNPFTASSGDFRGTPEGIVADSIDSRHPRLFFSGKLDEQSPHGRISYVSSQWFMVRPGTASLELEDWNHGQKQTIYSPGQNPPHYPLHNAIPWGKDVFVALWYRANAYVLSWTADTGLQSLLYWGADDTRGAGNLGTDGKDMVWTAGAGKPPDSAEAYQTYTIMTAPYTTNPQELQTKARVVRPELTSSAGIGHYSQAWAVGCGYAARATRGRTLIVTRLSDGTMWSIPHTTPEYNWLWSKALGVTCEHVYALATPNLFPEGPVIARFPLDSLGTPLSTDVVDVDDSGNPRAAKK